MAIFEPVGNRGDAKPTYITDAATFALTGSALDAALSAANTYAPAGTILATAGYGAMKQRGVDGAWSAL